MMPLEFVIALILLLIIVHSFCDKIANNVQSKVRWSQLINIIKGASYVAR